MPISLKFVPWDLIENKSTLIQVMAWSGTSNKPLTEPMMTQFNDAYMHHPASMTLRETAPSHAGPSNDTSKTIESFV